MGAHLVDDQCLRLAIGHRALILADEPTSALDDANCAAVFTLLRAQAEASGASIVHETGGRANLIAITCNEMLRRLDPNSRILGEADVERGLASRDHVSALAGWENLGGTPRESRLDRIIVYATVERDGFTLGELMRLLDGWDCNFSNEEVKRSLMRLDLAFILGEDAKDGRYRYRVPLFQRMRRRNEEPGLLLERELREART
jgi:hypothetical protein